MVKLCVFLLSFLLFLMRNVTVRSLFTCGETSLPSRNEMFCCALMLKDASRATIATKILFIDFAFLVRIDLQYCIDCMFIDC